MVRSILALNPGIPFAPATWRYIAFKGGSEPGVLSLTWYLERADGRAFVLSIAVNDAKHPIDEAATRDLVDWLSGAPGIDTAGFVHWLAGQTGCRLREHPDGADTHRSGFDREADRGHAGCVPLSDGTEGR